MISQSDFDGNMENMGWRFSCNLKDKCSPVFDNHVNSVKTYHDLRDKNIIDENVVLRSHCVGDCFSIVFETRDDIVKFIYDLVVYVNNEKEKFLAVPYNIKL